MPVSAEEAQKNLFRLEGPLVKKAAHALNLSVETTANIFDYLNFLIIVLLIGVPLYKVLPKLLHARGEKVRNDLESARKATTEANARLSAIEAKLSGLDEEIAQIRLQVERESQQDEARIKSTIGEESARVVAAAEQEIASSAAQARRGLRHFAADLAIEQAAKQLIFTPEIDRALIAEFLGDATVTGGQK
jgi:F-type H+-transporting ATPase subunit b